MPLPFLPTLAHTQRWALSLAVLSSMVFLPACSKSNDPTTRTTPSTPEAPAPEFFKVTLQSPVQLKNVQARIVSAATGQVLATQSIAKGNEAVFELERSRGSTSQLLYLEFFPAANGTSSYYDPITNREEPFILPLRHIIESSSTNQTALIDPYTDITFQRAQARIGWFTELDQLNQLNRLTRNAINGARLESDAVFAVRAAPVLNLENLESMQKGLKAEAAQLSTFDYYRFALGHIAHYAVQQRIIDSPYLRFSQKAGLDMLDGDLDGLTLHGFGENGSIILSNPLVLPILNTDVSKNKHPDMAVVQEPARTGYNLAVGSIIIDFFITNRIFPANSAEADSIRNFNYLNMNNRLPTDNKPLPPEKHFGLHSAGGGNYTPAFGLANTVNSQGTLNADDVSVANTSNDIEQLAGWYQNAQGCRLEIHPNGKIVLSQGNVSFSSDINRDTNDQLIRTNSDLTQPTYLVNAITPSTNRPSFMQIRTAGATVLSARYGRSLDPVPDELSQVDLSCDF